jgi:hypothetical protein
MVRCDADLMLSLSLIGGGRDPDWALGHYATDMT